MYLNSKKNAAYIIAEVGQNHQGDFEIASRYVEELSRTGVDAVKFQMRDNAYLFSAQQLEKEYNSPTAFASTYGAHRQALELDLDEIKKLRDLCVKFEVDFLCTPFDEPSLHNLFQMGNRVVKVSSFDFGNLPFLQKIIDKNVHFIMSTGGTDDITLEDAMAELLKITTNFSLLHCVSQYPCDASMVNLGRISDLKDKYPQITIGLSDHYNGLITGPLGYLAGARIFEKHVTFNRAWKGTDHPFALTIDGMRKFVRDINRASEMLVSPDAYKYGEEQVFKKLGKTFIASEDINRGDMFTIHNVRGRIVGEGIPVRNASKLLKRMSKCNYKAGDIISIKEII